mmetsp:Transcript_34047/g.72552  ORF Transcript_34047/g.72552 Transcript_34047/m.72552 type:complete len:97 (+) Transcript_34047:199-489(+)
MQQMIGMVRERRRLSGNDSDGDEIKIKNSGTENGPGGGEEREEIMIRRLSGRVWASSSVKAGGDGVHQRLRKDISLRVLSSFISFGLILVSPSAST